MQPSLEKPSGCPMGAGSARPWGPGILEGASLYLQGSLGTQKRPPGDQLLRKPSHRVLGR